MLLCLVNMGVSFVLGIPPVVVSSKTTRNGVPQKAQIFCTRNSALRLEEYFRGFLELLKFQHEDT